MSHKSLKDKQLAYARRLQRLQELHGITIPKSKPSSAVMPVKAVTTLITSADLQTMGYFRSDLGKSLILIAAVFGLEFLWYFASMSNYLSKLVKF